MAKEARAGGATALDGKVLHALRDRYDTAVAWGIATNAHRDWPSGRHPGYTLARRLQTRAAQIWRFTADFAVPFTNERASYCTSWVRSAVSRFLRWSARCVNSVARGTDISGQWAAEAGVVAAS